jgi:CheY-like chemotaxis protein
MRRILVTDPCADTLESTACLLRLWGHDVRGANTGPEALAVACTYQPDSVLMEIGLPGMDGYEVARRLRRQEGLPQLLLVAITGYGNERYRRRAWDAGFDRFLVKPVDPDVLREFLASSKVCEPRVVKRRCQIHRLSHAVSRPF